MEYFIILVLVVVIFIMLGRRSGRPTGTDGIYGGLDDIQREIAELKREVMNVRASVYDTAREIKSEMANRSFVAEERKEEPIYQEPITEVQTPPPAEVIPEPIVVEPQEDVQPEAAQVPMFDEEIIPLTEHEPPVFDMPFANTEPVAAFAEPGAGEKQEHNAPREFKEVESAMDKWYRNNPDLEKFIGENLINKIGIAILVLGIAFFVKYAIDQNWISELGRVCIGMLCGAILVGVAHYLHKGYRSFSSVLAGGGIAVFYFTIAFGFHQYHLMSQTGAFVAMVGITAFAIALSVLYDRLELAVIATIGGFIAPFLVSSGEGNYVALFVYLAILNAGVLSLAYFKRWSAINIIALFFTEAIYGGWLTQAINDPHKLYSSQNALVFASIFYVLFLGMNMVHQLRNKAQFKPFDFIILLLISSSYFAAGLTILHFVNGGAYQGLFTLALGLVNLVLAYYIYKKGQADRNLLFLLIGITLTFITLTIPIQLHGHAITLFWSAEFVLLYWLSVYSGIRIFKYSSLLICALTLISLAMDWEHAASTSGSGLTLIYNNMRGAVTNLVAIAAFGAWYALLIRNKEDDVAGIPAVTFARMPLIVAVVLLYLTFLFGVNLYFRALTSYTIPNVYYRLITELFVLVFILVTRKRESSTTGWLSFAALIICFLMQAASFGDTTTLRDNALQGKMPWLHMGMHWCDSILFVVLFVLVINILRRIHATVVNAKVGVNVVMSVMAVVVVSMELEHIYVVACYAPGRVQMLQEQYGKAGLTVIWALCSFTLMWLGMRRSQKVLRIISLVLFSIALLKLFLFDISDISEGGKILAFILLGVLLLTISFMYQKLKKIIIDDKKE